MTSEGCGGRSAHHRRSGGSVTSLSSSPRRNSRATLVAKHGRWRVRYRLQGLVEAGNRAAVHFIVLAVPAVHPDDGGLVTARAREYVAGLPSASAQ